jgi:hypothetical protein
MSESVCNKAWGEKEKGRQEPGREKEVSDTDRLLLKQEEESLCISFKTAVAVLSFLSVSQQHN